MKPAGLKGKNGLMSENERRACMNEQNPNPIPSPNPPPDQTSGGAAGNPPPAVNQDWREQRRAERWARRQRRAGRHTGWFAGIILILLGVIFLLQQLNVLFFFNWWAVFILIPAFWAFVAAWDNYQDASRMTRRATGALIVGLLLTALALIFLFNVGGGFVWPILLMAGGLALLVTALLPE